MLPQTVDEEVVAVLLVEDEDVEADSDEAADVEEEVEAAADPMAEVEAADSMVVNNNNPLRYLLLDMTVAPQIVVNRMNEHAMAVLRSGVVDMGIGRGILVRIRLRSVAFNFVTIKLPTLRTRILLQDRNRKQRRRLK
jgi:hypothetical protein